jgi:hypothetical protein
MMAAVANANTVFFMAVAFLVFSALNGWPRERFRSGRWTQGLTLKLILMNGCSMKYIEEYGAALDYAIANGCGSTRAGPT